MTKQITARDLMVDTVISLTSDMTLHAAWNLLFENRISGAPVVSSAGLVIGVLSQTDLVRETFLEGVTDFPRNTFYLDAPFYSHGDGWQSLTERLSSLRVEQAMTPDPICVSVDDTVAFLARKMRECHVHRLIVTKDRKLEGIVSSLDLLKVLETQ